MRTGLWLSIFVFISALFWPQLLDHSLLITALISTLILLCIPKLRVLAVIPCAAIYFSCYAQLTLTAQLFPSAANEQNVSITRFVNAQDHTIVVRIISLISENNRGYFRAKLIELDSDHLNYQPLIEMRWYKPTLHVQAGQVHRFVVRFKPVYGRANPAGFDRQKWSYGQHIGYQASIKKHLMIMDDSMSLRANFYQKIQQLTTNFTHQGAILALSFADKSLISLTQKQDIRNLGIAHLFAISGLHIGLCFSFCYLLCQILCLRLLPQQLLGWFSLRLINAGALLGAFSYAYLAGFSLPTQRAFLMLLLSVVLLSLKRRCSKLDLFVLVLFVVLLWDPLAVLSLSLWLSFCAFAFILMLIWAFPSLVQGGQQGGYLSVVYYLKLLVFIQCGLTLLMLPVQLLSFSAISVVAIAINLVAIPLFSLCIIPLMLSALLLSVLYPTGAHWLLFTCDRLLDYFFVATQAFSHHYLQLSHWQQSLYVVCLLLCAVLFFFHFQSRRQRQLSYGFAVLLLMLLAVNNKPQTPTWFVDIIDVGQGLSVLVRSGDQTLLYDTGASYPSGFNMAEHEIIPYLVSLGINNVDHLVISHSDTDHAGGTQPIITHLQVGHYWAGEALPVEQVFQPCRAGQSWSLHHLQIVVFSPAQLGKNNNNNSCVLRISDGTHSLLLTGDIEGKREKKLVQQYGERLRSDILIAAHHGSRHSSTDAFITAVQPSWSVFSAGFMNRWGFPAEEVVSRYKAHKIDTVNSGQSGLIRFQITAQAIKMKTFREDLAPYWYHRSLFP